jgi:hypothetical protein
MSARSSRFICPHCHAPIDPERLEAAANGLAEYRVCPECDGAIVFSRTTAVEGLADADAADAPRLPKMPRGRFRGIGQAPMPACLARLESDARIAVGPDRAPAETGHVAAASAA